MAYQINLTGQEIDERLQNVGTPEDVAAADGTLYARISKNADDVDELNDTMLHIQDAQKATDKTVTQHTADISTLQTALKTKANLVLGKVSVNELPVATSLGNPNNGTIPSTFAVSKAINDKIVGLLNWQGVKDTTDEIKDIALAKKGDVWHSNEDGSEWVCTEDIFTADHSVWEELGTPIDLSGYYTKNEVDKKVKPLADSIGTDSDAASANSSVYARIKKNKTDIADIGSRQTNIEKVVSGARREAYFSLRFLNLIVNSKFIADIGNIEVMLYRWSGKRYSELELFTKNDIGKSQKIIQYVIILKRDENGANILTPYIHYNDDATEEMLVDALKNAFGGRISHGRHKKRRWRLQAFLSGRPITAPFDFRVSVDHSDVVSLTKEGMMRSVPKAEEVVYDGFFSSTEWIKCKKGEVINCDYNASEKRFPQPGDFIESNRRGIVVASEYNSDGSHRILWTVGRTLYEIGIGGMVIEPSFVFYCTSPAKKLCDDIYDYASKMSSGTLRDLYISAGAKYNEQTGYYELNGLTDITEEQMRTIWQEDLSGWYQKGRTNLTRNISVKGNSGGYNGGIDIACICINNKNLQVFNLGTDCFARYMDSAFRECSNLETIDTRFRVVPYDTSLGINTFRGCIKLKDVRFNNHYLRMKATLNLYDSPLISKESVLSAITTTDNASATSAGFLTITLHADAYARLKDDADIIAALEAKNGVVTLVSA